MSRGLLLAQDVGDVISAERTGRCSFLDRIGYRFGSILADQLQDLGKLPRQGAIRIGHVAQVGFKHGTGTQIFEDGEETLLRSRPFGRGTQLGQLGIEAIGAQSLTAAPATRIGDDFIDAVINGD